MGGGFQNSHRGFAHQCLTVDAAFARYYKVATGEKFFEMEGIEHQLYSPTKTGTQQGAEGSAQTSGCTCARDVGHIYLVIFSDDFGKMMHPSVELFDHLPVGTFLGSKNISSSLRATEGIGDIAGHSDVNSFKFGKNMGRINRGNPFKRFAASGKRYSFCIKEAETKRTEHPCAGIVRSTSANAYE